VTPTGTAVALPTTRQLLEGMSQSLRSASEARWILSHCAGVDVGALVARGDVALAPRVVAQTRDLVDRRLAGEPLQYLLGTWAFRTLELRVDRRALIPRPETEQVVSAALDELGAQAARTSGAAGVVAADLGTGSGAIALSLAAEYPVSGVGLEVWATDLSSDALVLLDENLAELATRTPHASGRVHVRRGSWFDALPSRLAGALHLVVSNPPYVSEAEFQALDPTIRDYEPWAALVPGPSGLEAIESLLVEAPGWLVPRGSLVVELAPAQAPTVLHRAAELGYAQAEIRDDLTGRPRMLVARSRRA
jgi:release factor glutamine methyltransferase